MLRLGDLWQTRLVKASLFAKPVIDDGRIVWGRSTILFKPCASPPTGGGPRDERLSVLLAVAGVSQPSDGLALFKTVGAEWQRGERAIAAIRLAFAPIPPLDEKGAYRLFLAEEALDAGLDPALLLREFRIDDSIEILRYNRDQPRVPKGNGRESGQFGSATQAGQPDVRRGWSRLPGDAAGLITPRQSGRRCRGSASGQTDQSRRSYAKRGPGQPLSVAMAYYLATLGGSGEAKYDDCKRTAMLALILEMKKGDMAEIKTKTSAWLIWQDFAQDEDGAGPKFDAQIKRQVEGVK